MGYYGPSATTESSGELDDNSMARCVMETGSFQEVAARELEAHLSASTQVTVVGGSASAVLNTPVGKSPDRLIGNDTFELDAMAADIMDAHVAQSRFDKTGQFEDIHDNIPPMCRSDFQVFVQGLEEAFRPAGPRTNIGLYKSTGRTVILTTFRTLTQKARKRRRVKHRVVVMFEGGDEEEPSDVDYAADQSEEETDDEIEKDPDDMETDE
ncbi:hypothetical protein TARUN_1856 [Trichoderma arundinaceum]|uniref:Uncharacterized protein n=1 Tax=Trichoderma arundinaceum TaxID=490622 RepID=A0A395NWA6_TRIAR|nr:hypothetical protein TARUN_1856 [Trichoderma arundinaceum]